MEMLYFDFDHGIERLLFVRFDQGARRVDFRFEQSPDATYDDEELEVPIVTVRASTQCSNDDQFFSFCRALVIAMRETPFSLQDPTKTPFAAMPQENVVLDGIAGGSSPSALTCRVPAEIASQVFSAERLPEWLRPLIGTDG